LKELRARLGVTVREVEEQIKKSPRYKEILNFLFPTTWLTRLEKHKRSTQAFINFSVCVQSTGIRVSELLPMFGIDLRIA